MKTIIHFGLGCVLSLLTSVASAADKPSKIPEYLLRFAFNPDLPDSRYIGYDGGPGTNVDGSYHNFRGFGGHRVTIGYANRKFEIDFTHKNGKEFRFQIGSYWWPPSGNHGLVRVAVFRSSGDEILLAVGGVPAAIIYPDDMRARVVGYNGDDKDKILTPESLAVFDKMAQPNPQTEQGAAGQPASHPDSKSEENQEPQPKSEVRSR